MPLITLLFLAAMLSLPATAGQPARLAGVHYLGDLPTRIAHDNGHFRRHGAAVELHTGNSGRQNLQALMAGETDYALMALPPFVLSMASTRAHERPVILASLVHSSRLNHVVSLAGSQVERPADLAGRRLGMMRGTNAQFMWWLFAAYHRLDPDVVEAVFLPIEQLGPALKQGEIDAAIMWEPWVMQLESASKRTVRRLPGSDVYTEHWVLVTRPQTVEESPETTRAILAAYRDAIRDIESSPAAALSLYARSNELPPGHVRSRIALPLFGLNLNWSLLMTLELTLEWASSTGEFTHPEDLRDPLALIETGPLRAVSPGAVGIPSDLPVIGGSVR